MEFIDNLESWSQPDVCRICFSSKGTWDLFATYKTEGGVNEIYSKIILDCFKISLPSFPDGQLSCDACVDRLRDAFSFKKQVERAVELFTLNVINKKESCGEYFHNWVSNDNKDDTQLKLSDPESKRDEFEKDYVPYSEDRNDFEPCVEDCTVDITRTGFPLSWSRDDWSTGATTECKPVETSGKIEIIHQSKQISERKRIKLTCDTILRETTACPFRHHKSWFRCFFCTQTFMDIPSLREHTIKTHNNIEDQIKQLKRYPRSVQIDITELNCRKCNLNFTNIDLITEHLKSVHNKVIYKECIADYKLNTIPYTCHLCEKQFHVFRTLTTHLNKHYANFICAVCGKSFLNSKRLKVHNRTHEIGVFPCGQCGKVLKTRSSYVNHMESHSKRVLRCHICSKPMKHYNDRIKHMSEAHAITHTFECGVCARSYNVQHSLRAHVRHAHARGSTRPRRPDTVCKQK